MRPALARHRRHSAREHALAPFDLATAIASLTPHLRPVAAVEALEDIAGFLAGSAPIWQGGAIEVRLQGSPRADCLACVTTHGDARARLAAALDAQRPLHPSLASAEQLLRAWCDRDGAMADVETLWFEWDRDGSKRPPTLVWFAIDRRFGDRDVDWQLEALASASRMLHGRSPPAGVVGRLRSVLSSLDGGSLARGATWLWPRGRSACRVFVEHDPSRIASWLVDIGWRGDRRWLDRWVRRLGAPWEPIFCQLEVGDAVGNYLGLEPRQTAVGFPEREDRRRLLARLVKANLADPDRASAVLAWPGRGPGIDSTTVVLQRIFHLKVSIGDDGLESAKAYLDFSAAVS